MWQWEIVLLCLSRNEEITVVGKGYNSKDIADWEMKMWLSKLLPSFYLFRIVKSETKEV